MRRWRFSTRDLLAAVVLVAAAVMFFVSVDRRVNVHNSRICGLAFTSDGRTLVVGSMDAVNGRSEFAVYDRSTERLRMRAPTGSQFLAELGISPDGRLVAIGGMDDVVQVHDLNDGRVVAELPGASLGTRKLLFSPDGTQLIVGGRDAVVRVWDTRTWKLIRTIPGLAMRFSSDGTSLICKDADNIFAVQDGRRRVLSSSSDATPGSHSAFVSSDGSLLVSHGSLFATGSRDGTVSISDTSTYEELFCERFDGGEVADLAFAPQSNLLAAGIGRRFDNRIELERVILIDPQRGKARSIESEARYAAMRFNGDGTLLALGELSGGGVQLHDVESGQVSRVVVHDDSGVLQIVLSALVFVGTLCGWRILRRRAWRANAAGAPA